MYASRAYKTRNGSWLKTRSMRSFLKIKKFRGDSENAVRIQIYTVKISAQLTLNHRIYSVF